MICTDSCCRWNPDDGAPEAIRIGQPTVHVARKDHSTPCSTCGGAIKVGNRYERQVWRVDGDMAHELRHLGAECEPEW